MIGAGYIAPRHTKAIKDVGGNLLAFIDPCDSVGWIDNYFPQARYFSEFERFDRYADKLQRQGVKIDYCVIVTANYLHDANCRWALRNGMNAICEKPLVTHEHNLDALLELEKETDHKVWGLYQLRYHPEVQRMKDLVITYWDEPAIVNIDYRTPRGKWYGYSWKNDIEKSGGLATNIGCHLFDVCAYLFGKCESIKVERLFKDLVSGVLTFGRAKVNWTLSTQQGESRRVFEVNGRPFDLNSGFADLHTKVYQEILAGNGVGIEDVRESTRICEAIRNTGT